ncbi:MAG: NAD(P)H-dependent oxidoreductase [Acidimicrobiia bacterium]|jgi:multimeric flavodoxin WrbA|nr:NAD(P)H-dependent oxidoreductase [Acidimicrobiia bacterium]
MDLTAVMLNCSLSPSPAESSTDVLLGQVADAFGDRGVAAGEPIRVVDHDVKPGVESDMGDGDAWPALRRRILDADILVLGTPVWMGQPSSVAKRVLERLDAFLAETDDKGRMISWDRVAMVAVVGNEDGAHHISAELYQALSDVGFTIAANAVTYWVGEAMGATDYRELDETPEKVASATAMAVATTAHLARVLRADPYPPV